MYSFNVMPTFWFNEILFTDLAKFLHFDLENPDYC